MSLLYALTCDASLGGIVGFSGHIFRSFDLKNKGITFFMFRNFTNADVSW